jgi:hypothetical protein
MYRALLIASMFTGTINGESMKLVKKETGRVVVEFKDNTVKFYSPSLEAEIRRDGVSIPPIMRAQFGGEEVIFIDDPLFEKAFIEVYWPLCMASANSPYEWQN